jgi:hypothetical protein
VAPRTIHRDVQASRPRAFPSTRSEAPREG